MAHQLTLEPVMAARITPEQIDLIISLRLAGRSVRDVARAAGVNPRTVQERYGRYLSEVASERAEHLEHERAEAIVRMERAAAEAWAAWELSCADDGGADPRFLAEYRQAMSQAERLRGLQVAKVEHTGTVTVDATDAKQALLDKLSQLAPAE